MHNDRLSEDSSSESEENTHPIVVKGGFQDKNKIHELTSKANALQIQKEQLIISYENRLSEERRRAYEFSCINEKLTNKNKNLFDENEKLKDTLDQVACQNQNLTREIETLKEHVDQLMSVNRRTAQFHHSGEFDQLQFVKEMTNKDDQIKKHQQEIETLKSQLSKGTDNVFSRDSDRQVSILRQQNQQLLRKLETNKKREIDVKREYETLLQSKEDIIRKIANQSDEHSKSILLSKDKSISQLKRELGQAQQFLEEKKRQIRAVDQKNHNLEKEFNKICRSSKRKEDDLMHQHEVEKQEIVKSYSQKIKNYLKEKEEKIQNLQTARYEAQAQVGNFKIQINRLKNQMSSTGQFNSYLQNLNKQNQVAKKKMQESIAEKDKEISELRQQTLNQSNELKKTIAQYKKHSDDQSERFEELLSQKNTQIEKLENRLKHITEQEQSQQQQHSLNLKKSIEALKSENQELRASLNRLTQKYQQKNEKFHSLETNIKKQYDERVQSLEEELIRITNKSSLQPSNGLNESEVKVSHQMKEQCDRLKMVNQILEMDKTQKEEECVRLQEKLQQVEKNISKLQKDLKQNAKDIKDKGQDYRLLQHAYEELEQKYKDGVKDLHGKIQQMNDLLNNERRKNDKRKNEYKLSQERLLNEVKKLKMANQELQEEIEGLKNEKGQDVFQMEEKIQRLAHQISIINRQRESMARANQQMLRKKMSSFQQQREKMLEYINELQDKSNLLSSKVIAMQTISVNPNRENQRELRDLNKENYNLKLQLSQSLKEINELLQKYKDMEEKYKETASQEEFLRDKFDTLHQRYRQGCRQKNRVIAELDTSYDQIQKLNAVLRGKQKEVTISRIGNSYVAERDISPNTHWRRNDEMNSPYSPRPIVSPQQINMSSSKIKAVSNRIENSALRKEMKRYY